MSSSVPASPPRARIVSLADTSGSWRSGPVLIASGLRRRLVGLRPWSLGLGLLVAGGSVHGIGMAEPLGVVAVDARGRVLRVGRLPPRGIVHVPGAGCVIELPPETSLPPVGATLVAVGSRDAHRPGA